MRPANAFLWWTIVIFLWIYLIPILTVGFILCIPFFLVVSPILFIITAFVIYYLKDDIFIGSNIRDIISSIPYELWFGSIDNIKVPKYPVLITSHPHGFLCTGILLSTHFVPGSTTLFTVSPWLFTIPIVGWLAKHAGAIPANEKDIMNALKKSSVIIVPGGVPELVSNKPYTRRHGFLRIAQKARVPILPVITETSFYDHLSMPMEEWRVYIAKKYGLPIMVPPIGWYYTWIPNPKPIKMKQMDLFKEIGNNIESSRQKYYNMLR